MTTTRLFLEPLAAAECWTLLGSARLGRLSITLDALPVILPVFYAVEGESVVFCAAPESRLARATVGSVVAFEADGYELASDAGWSVLLQGIAQEVTDRDRLSRLEGRDLRCLVGPGDGQQIIALPARTIEGRTFAGSDSQRGEDKSRDRTA